MTEHRTRFIVIPACTCGWRGEELTGPTSEHGALIKWSEHARACRKEDSE